MGITFTLPNVGLGMKMTALLYNAEQNQIRSDLYLTGVTLSDTIQRSNLTAPSFPGYSTQFPGGGSVSSSNTQTIASLSLNPVTFTCTAAPSAPVTVQGGYMWLNVLSANLLAIADLPGGPQVVSQPGDSIVLQCTITDQRAPGQP